MRTRSFFSLLFVMAIPLLGAKGGCGGEVSLGSDACAESACGGMPELACWDGSSPFTGKCLKKTDGTCGWEPRKCPDKPAECSTCAIPEIACADGSSPYTGKCVTDPATAKCIAEYKGCSGECAKEECGPALGMPSYTCEDGSTGGSTGRCLRGADGKCGWEVKDCPRKCETTDCGAPPPIAPCKDGTAPPMSCVRSADGAACVWNVGMCGVTACEKVTMLPRKCATKSDCTVNLHMTNCCGSMHAIGQTKSVIDEFGPLEKECQASYPGCGCAAMPTVDDYGKMGTEFDVDCVSGTCTSFVTKGI
jgi:hypothetical protein